MIYRITDTQKAAGLFENWQETLIWSCLQGVMGEIYGNDENEPESAMAVLGDFAFLAGRPDKELVCYKPDWHKADFIIIVPQNDSWNELIETCYQDRAKKVVRYAIEKETENPDIFDREKLQNVVDTLPREYELRLIDEELFYQCTKEDWCRDFVSNYKDYEEYQRLGLGVVALHEGKMVSGASSYSGYQGGIEIEIDTLEPYRRRGLAYACGAKLILECLERNLYPSWDAQNKWSVALAEKLGYHFSHEYTAYEITGPSY